MIRIRLEPGGKEFELYRIRTVLGLLNKLDLRPTMALVIRDGSLLTPDRRVANGDEILVRKVTSAG